MWQNINNIDASKKDLSVEKLLPKSKWKGIAKKSNFSNVGC